MVSNVKRRTLTEQGAIDRELHQELVDRYGDQIQRSIDVFQIALLFESNGVNDRVAANQYGAGNVMELAERMDQLVPFRAAEPAPPAPGLRPVARGLVRGCAFVLVALTTMGAAVATDDPASAAVLIGASMAATAAMSPLSFLAHLIQARAPKGGAVTALGALYRLGLLVTLPIAVAVGALTGPTNGLIVAGLLAYAQATVVVLVLGRTGVFALALTPGGIVAICSLASDGVIVPAGVAAAIGGVGAAVLVVFALVAVGRRGRLSDEIGALEMRATWPFLRAGLATAVFVGPFVWCLGQLGPLGGADGRTWLILAAPMLVPLAIGDAAVARLRMNVERAAHTAPEPHQFRRRVDWALARIWLQMVAVGATTVVLSALVDSVEGVGSGLELAACFWLVGAVLSARLSDPDPYDRLGPAVVTALALHLAVLALAGDRLTTSQTVGTALGGLVVGFLVIEVDIWRRSRRLSTHRWSI